MYRCSQIVNQFVCADFRILTWKFFCFAFGNMAACPNTKKMPRRLVAITLILIARQAHSATVSKRRDYALPTT